MNQKYLLGAEIDNKFSRGPTAMGRETSEKLTKMIFFHAVSRRKRGKIIARSIRADDSND
jgi:hypothetical protein